MCIFLRGHGGELFAHLDTTQSKESQLVISPQDVWVVECTEFARSCDVFFLIIIIIIIIIYYINIMF